jgi:Flp pilus assembly pilin Flp
MKRVSAKDHHSQSVAAEYALIAAVIGLAMLVTLFGIGGKAASALDTAAAMLGWR